MNELKQFIDYIAVEKQYSRRTVEAYQKDVRSFYVFLGETEETFDPHKPDEGDIKCWMLGMMERGNKPRSIKRRLSSLSSFYRFMLKQGITERDITRKVISPKVDKPLPVFFRPSEMDAVTAYDADADDYRSMRNCLVIELLYQTGMRQAELLGLKDRDVDIVTRQIRIFGKRKKERIVPIGANLAAQIATFRVVRDEWRLVPTHRRFVHNPEVLIDLTRNTLYNIVCARMSEVSTLKKHSPHVLRHTFATAMLNNGANIRAIQSLLGHASLQTTQVYAHTTFDQVKAVYAAAHPRARKQQPAPHNDKR